MFFSFIIPALNEEKYIGVCVDSIQSQKGSDFEVIVVDNGSTDKTAEVAEAHGARVIHESIKGISSARNAGVKAAEGDIVCFIDADGVLSPNWLTEARECLNNPKVDAVTGLCVYGNKSLLKKAWYNTYTVIAYSSLLISNTFFNTPFLGANNTAIRKDIYNTIGGFQNLLGEDYWLTKRYLSYRNRQKVIVKLTMSVEYSSRGFEKTGYIKTLAYWMKGIYNRKSQDGYTYETKK